MKFISSFNDIIFHYFILLLSTRVKHWQLIEVGEHSIVFQFAFTIISHHNAGLVISENLILLNLGKTWSRANYSCTLILVDLIIWNVIAAIKHNDSVTVIIDIIMLNPTKTSFDAEDSFW